MEWAMIFAALCSVFDCARQRIPAAVLAAGGAAGIVFAGLQIYQGKWEWHEVLLALLPGAVLWAFSMATEGKLGRGDGDMVLVLGLFMGWELCLGVLCAACLLAAVFSGIGLAVKKFGKKSRIPFAPFLLAAAVLVWIVSVWKPGM